MTEIIKINPLNPETYLLKKGKDLLQDGRIIGYPTDTVYGLGANAFNSKAIRKIFTLKERDFSKPILLVISKEFNLREIVAEVPSQALKLIKTFWPGPLTIIFKAGKKLPSILTGEKGTVGIRVPDNLITLKLLSLCKFPVTSTSANPSGMPSANNALQVDKYFPDKIDLIIDGGKCNNPAPSTIVDFTEGKIKIVREGRIGKDELLNTLTN